MLTIISSILVFSVIVLVHEYGHYKAAKSVGIRVYEFAIGMGPTLFKKEKNGTVYSVRAIPIGGFVQMEGEDEDSKTSTSFGTKTIPQRAKVMFAGSFMNFVLALVLFVIIALSFGVYGNHIDYIDENSNEYKAGLRKGDQIISMNGNKAYLWEDIFYEIIPPEQKTYELEYKRDGQIKKAVIDKSFRKVIGVTSKSENGVTTTTVSPTDITTPAYKAGIMDGDKIVKINDVPVNTWEELTNLIEQSKDTVKVTVDRKNETFDFNIDLKEQVSVKFDTALERSFTTVIFSSLYKTIYYIKLMFKTISQLITGKLGSDALGGPVMVISMVGEAAESGLLTLMSFVAFISINIGFINMLPIPALDGSKLMFLLIEGIRGKKLPVEKEGYIHFVGFVVLIGFMLFISYKDILRVLRI